MDKKKSYAVCRTYGMQAKGRFKADHKQTCWSARKLRKIDLENRSLNHKKRMHKNTRRHNGFCVHIQGAMGTKAHTLRLAYAHLHLLIRNLLFLSKIPVSRALHVWDKLGCRAPLVQPQAHIPSGE